MLAAKASWPLMPLPWHAIALQRPSGHFEIILEVNHSQRPHGHPCVNDFQMPHGHPCMQYVMWHIYIYLYICLDIDILVYGCSGWLVSLFFLLNILFLF